MIRAFIAIEIDPQLVRQISAVVTDLQPRIAGIRWVSQANFHLTLKFLGDIEEKQNRTYRASLGACASPLSALHHKC